MEDILIELLESFGYPVIRQGSLSQNDDYDPTFFTFWNNGEHEQSAYDNLTASVIYDFEVNVYADDPTTVYDLLKQARTLLKSKGWIIVDRGYDVASDVDTHTGRGMNVIFLKNEN